MSSRDPLVLIGDNACSRNPSRSHLRDDDLLLQLRNATRKEHQRLERHPLLHALRKRRVRVPDYIALIARLHAYHRALEPPLETVRSAHVSPTADYRWHCRDEMLAADLADLGAATLAARAVALPRLDSLDHAIGVMYVFEGATLGGRIIAPWLRDRLGLTATRGARYFNFYQSDSWPAFRDWARAAVCDVDAAMDAATHTFTTLSRCLDGPDEAAPC